MQSATDIISSLFWFNNDEEDNEPVIIDQFVERVNDFSSQYGSEISVSYTAINLRGPPSNFPYYGDYPQAFVMRTYGKWWEEAPSAQEDFMPQNTRSVASQDFIEVSFKRPVYPLELSLFETYNPGALVRIWALGGTTWYLLWEGQPEYVGDTPRIFCPPLRIVDVLTKTLRLEFNHRLLPYYTELDAVLLKGREEGTLVKVKKNHFSYCSLFNGKTPDDATGKLLTKIMASNLHQSVGPAALSKPTTVLNKIQPVLGDFHQLPDETILSVFIYLDIQSLCRCAQVNKHFYRLASDSILYRSIDLRPYWHCMQSQVLSTLSTRCKFLQRLDLSWCGSHTSISSHYVISFLKDCGSELTHLRMNCCQFVKDLVLKAIVWFCANLQELCLRSVSQCLDWKSLSSLSKLKRLDVYRTNMTTSAAVAIIKANTGLLHLNVGSCKHIESMDEVAFALGANCPKLISVDFWKSYSLTSNGIRALSNCIQLQELDVGWCLQAGGSGDWLTYLPGRELRKLFLGALRGVCDRDLRAILPRLRRLEQLDLLGVRSVTADICREILAECHNLRLLDVSFCDQIQEMQVHQWRKLYPHVSIKRSFQSPNLYSAPTHYFFAPTFE